MEPLDKNVISNHFFYIDNNKNTTIIAFSCHDAHRHEHKKFDMYFLKNFTEANILFVRDLNNSWYHHPAPDDSSSGDALLNTIKEIIKDQERVICVGSSMGAYGAIFFGIRLKVSLVIALAPQITLDIDQLNSLNDWRHRDDMERINPLITRGEYKDLSSIYPLTDTKINIYFGENDEGDRKLFEMIKDNNSYNKMLIPRVNHGLVNIFHASGVLKKIIFNGLETSTQYDPTQEIELYCNQVNHNLHINNNLKITKNHLEMNISLELANPSLWHEKDAPRFYTVVQNQSNGKHELWRIEDIHPLPSSNEGIINFRSCIDHSHYENTNFIAEIQIFRGKTNMSDAGYTPYYLHFEKNGILIPKGLTKGSDPVYSFNNQEDFEITFYDQNI